MQKPESFEVSKQEGGEISVDLEIGTEAVPADIPRSSGRFAGNVLIMAGGTAIAQGLSVLLAPIVARLFAPQAFGLAALFSSITIIIGAVVNLRYELAIHIPKSDEDAANLLAISLGSALGFCGLSVAIILIAGDPLLVLIDAPELKPFLWLIPVAVLVRGFFQALSQWLARRKRFGGISLASVSESITTNGLQVGMGTAGLGVPGWLIGSRIMGSIISMGLLSAQAWRRDGQVFRQTISRDRMRAQAIRFKKFPLYSTWSALLNVVSWQMPTLLLSAFFSTSIVGFYDLGTRTLRLPMDLLGNAIAKVFLQRAAKAGWDGDLAIVVEGVFKRLVAIGMFPMLLLGLIGRDAFALVFGSNWAVAGVYAQILSVWTFFWFISSPLSTLFTILEKLEFGLRLNMVNLATRLTSLLIGGLLNDAKLALFLFGASGVVVYGYLAYSILAEAGVSRMTTTKILLNNLLISLPAIVLIAAMQIFGVSSLIVLVVAGILVIAYLAYRVLIDHQLRTGLLAFFKIRT
jgi:lipopolysaccharide exporter